jgi:hypothetical protein
VVNFPLRLQKLISATRYSCTIQKMLRWDWKYCSWLWSAREENYTQSVKHLMVNYQTLSLFMLQSCRPRSMRAITFKLISHLSFYYTYWCYVIHS